MDKKTIRVIKNHILHEAKIVKQIAESGKGKMDADTAMIYKGRMLAYKEMLDYLIGVQANCNLPMEGSCGTILDKH